MRTLLPFLLTFSPAWADSPPSTDHADVVMVAAGGEPGAFTFSVTIRSPDTGCERYADWWEVVRADGTLAYRRVLAHSHPSEQPFTRPGGPVPIAPDEEVWVRAHMHPDGYGGVVVRGSVTGGFKVTEAKEGFASELVKEAPLPGECPF